MHDNDAPAISQPDRLDEPLSRAEKTRYVVRVSGDLERQRALSMLRLAIGRPCWSAMASQRTDWVIVLDLGEKKRRSMRLANPRLSFLQRTFEGEYSFLIECVWRLDGASGVIASCFDENHPGGPMHKGLSQIVGSQLEHADISSAGFDLSLGFEGGYALRCMSTEVDPKRNRNNWSLWTPQGLVTIGPRGRLSVETSREAEKRHRAHKRTLAQEEDDLVSKFLGGEEPDGPGDDESGGDESGGDESGGDESGGDEA
jgi:hypothetical protein